MRCDDNLLRDGGGLKHLNDHELRISCLKAIICNDVSFLNSIVGEFARSKHNSTR